MKKLKKRGERIIGKLSLRMFNSFQRKKLVREFKKMIAQNEIPRELVNRKNKNVANLFFETTVASHLGKLRSGLRFIQVGAHHGRGADIVHRYLHQEGSQGILIEPNPNTFSELQENFGERSGFILLQNAISTTPGPMSFYYFDFPYPKLKFTSRMSSLSKDHLLKHTPRICREFLKMKLPKPDVDQYIRCVEVQSIRLEEVIESYKIDSIDFLQIDAEGHDFEVIKSMNFEVRPLVIRYEHGHLKSKNECREYLEVRDYSVCEYSWFDSLAFCNRGYFSNLDKSFC
jgi:FkbM family methyltransferase